MTVLYFAQARRLTGIAADTFEVARPLDADELWAEIARRHPDLVLLRAVVRLARNGEFAGPDERFAPGDEVALIPPVSGG